MFKKGNITEILEAHKAECGENKRLAYTNAGKQLGRLLKEGKIDEADISFKALLEASVAESGYSEIPWGDNSNDIEELQEAITAGPFPKLTRYLIHSLMIPEFEYRKQELKPLFTEGNTNKADKEIIEGFTSMEGVEFVAAQHPYQETDFHEKYAEIFMNKYGKMISLTREMLMEDKSQRIISKAKSIGDKWADQFEEFIIQTLELRPRSLNPFESSSKLQSAVFDGTSVSQANFYSADHSSLAYMGAQVNKNLITSNGLDTAGLTAAYKEFPDFLDEDGDRITVRPKIMIVHPDNAVTAWQLTNSDGVYDSDKHAKNPYGPSGMRTLRIIQSPYINTATDWYIGDPSKQLVVLWGDKPAVVSMKGGEADFRRDIVMSWKMSTIVGAGMRDYRYLIKNTA